MNSLKGLRVARISSISFPMLTQLGPQLEAMNQAGCKITLISSPDELSEDMASRFNFCEFIPVPIQREISLMADLKSLFFLWNLFRKNKFHIVHSLTPKAGLLCSIAAFIAGVPIRLHTFTGQPWVTMHGLKRWIVKSCDKVVARLNTKCFTDSMSQRNFLIQSGVIGSDNIKVIGQGSLAGVDVLRFNSDAYTQEQKNQIRQSLNIDESAFVFLFIGRVTEDKGVFELLDAFYEVLLVNPDATLLIVGPLESEVGPLCNTITEKLGPGKVIFNGFTAAPQRFLAVSDVLCLPSYREGFGTVVIEAAAMGLPAIGTRIYGLTDAIVEGETGILVDPKSRSQLSDAMQKIMLDKSLRVRLGTHAKNRAINEFDSRKCGSLFIKEYERLLNEDKSIG